MQPLILQLLIDFRRQLHEHPQPSLKQFETTKKIQAMLLLLGVKQHQIKHVNPTGLIVDINGAAPPKGRDFCIALRADIDALQMTQKNQSISYKSKNQGIAHTCGHDGHAACLLALLPPLIPQLPKIPSNKTVRLLFQPSEQSSIHSGAQIMIDQGCLEGVNQIYGYHNHNSVPLAHLWTKEGPVMSIPTFLSIDIIGEGGHGSEPESLKIALDRSIEFYRSFLQFTEDLKSKNIDRFVCTVPVFKSGEIYNVISDKVHLEGSLRTFTYELRDIIVNKIKQMLEEIRQEGFNYDFHFKSGVINSNSHIQNSHIQRLGRQIFGEDKVGPGLLPVRASEDFGSYTQKVPGAFFFVSGGTKNNQPQPHSPIYNFNDDLIEILSNFWFKLVEDRLNSE